MKNIFLFILVLLSFDLFAQRNDTLTLWTEIPDYSYETDPFFANFHGIRDILNITLVQISDQTANNFMHYTCIKLQLSTFPQEIGTVHYFIHDTVETLFCWKGLTISQGFNLHLEGISESGKMFGTILFHGINNQYEIRSKKDDLYYVIRYKDPTEFVPDQHMKTWPPARRYPVK
jgi:hypothetical protein